MTARDGPENQRSHSDATFDFALEPALWRGAALDLFTRLPISAQCKAMLQQRYDDPDLPYHGAGHIGVLWLRFLAHGGSAGDIGMGLAIAFHDAVYQPGARDNEIRSAALLRETVGDGADVAWAETAILATAHHLGYGGGDPRVQRLLDLDLTPLAETPQIVASNWAALRHEGRRRFTDRSWAEEQCRFFAMMLAEPAIYRSGLASFYDSAARRNLAAGAAQFGALLAPNRT